MKKKVYCEVLKEYRVPYTILEGTIYLVRYGYVDWQKDGNEQLVIYILMEYKGKIKYTNPPHLLIENDSTGRSDFTRVMKAIGMLRREFKLSDITRKELIKDDNEEIQ